MTEDWTLAGKINGSFGIKGWVKVFSHTSPRENIFQYRHLKLQHKEHSKVVEVLEGKVQGKKLIARLSGVTDANEADALFGFDVYIDANQIPELAEDEFYWKDLIGLTVKSVEGVHFGQVKKLMETGAHDVLEVKPTVGSIDQENRLIPFVFDHIVKSVDLSSQEIVVDWDVDF